MSPIVTPNRATENLTDLDGPSLRSKFGAALLAAASALPTAAVATGGAALTACGGGTNYEVVGQLPNPTPISGAELLAQLKIGEMQIQVVGVADATSPAPDFKLVFDIVAKNKQPGVGDGQLKSIPTLASEISEGLVSVTSAEIRIQAINSNGEIVIAPGLTDGDGYFLPDMIAPYLAGGVEAHPGAYAVHLDDLELLAAASGDNLLGLLVSGGGTIVALGSDEATTDYYMDQEVFLPLTDKVINDLSPHGVKNQADIDDNGILQLVPNRDVNGELTDGGQNIKDNSTEDAPGSED